MASLTQLITFCFSLALLISTSNSLTCTSQKFKKNKVFSNCTDLPVLNSFLHFTYDSSNSSLSIAFVAAPAKPEGWIAWAINPISTGMIGSQALIAFKNNNGSVIVNKYNIRSFTPPQPSNLSFDVWDLSAEVDGGNMVIFATVKVPEKAEKVNQVWQVGGSVSGGVPQAHEMSDANLNSEGVLEFVAVSSSPAPAPGPSTDKSGSISNGKWNFGLLFGLFVSIGIFVSF